MPVVIRFGRFKFYIYPKDHCPPHVHIVAQGHEAKIAIQSGQCLAVYGFKPKVVKILSEVVIKNKDLLMEAWNNYEGEK